MKFILPLLAAEERPFKILPQGDELLWGSIAFLILAVVLIKLVGPKMTAAFENRTNAIQGQLEEAERVKREADQIQEQYRAQLADARNEGNRVIEEAKRTAEAVRAEILAKAEKEATDVIARAQQDAANERERVMGELRGTLGDLSIQLAQRVIEAELSNPQAQRALVDRAIAELAGSNGSN